MLSKDPPTGFFRDGYCRTGPEDKGNRSVAATVNQEFVNPTNSKGNNLREVGVRRTARSGISVQDGGKPSMLRKRGSCHNQWYRGYISMPLTQWRWIRSSMEI